MLKVKPTIQLLAITLAISSLCLSSCGEDYTNNRSGAIINTQSEKEFFEKINLLISETSILKAPGFQNPVICTYYNLSIEKDSLCLNYNNPEGKK